MLNLTTYNQSLEAWIHKHGLGLPGQSEAQSNKLELAEAAAKAKLMEVCGMFE